ncbi:DNA topoisomerase 2-binding protein 1 [Glugoides intestinalis]
MEISQSFEIQNTPAHEIQIATTAISRMELSAVELPQSIALSPTLTPRTRFLVTYKAVFTEKYIQALLWNIPIVNCMFLYNPTANYKQFEMKAFQGAIFTTSGISDETYINYFVLLGAVYEPNCTIFIDFLICDNQESEKYKFCEKYEIPIIKTSKAFSNDYMLFRKKARYDAKSLKPKAMLFERIFFLDPKLPKTLFNKLRRIIIENEGSRVSTINNETEYIITMNFDEYKDYSTKIIHYQYLFDCCESNAVLYPEFFQYNFPACKKVLMNAICAVDKDIENAKEYVNKLKSLGSIVKATPDSRCTHYFTKKTHSSKERGSSFTVISPEWIDQCLSTLKHVKEDRYTMNKPSLSLSRKLSLKKEVEMLFQFTGLPAFLKENAIQKFNKYGIKFVDSDKFEKCTHLIMGTINSSEKFFCSLVSGSWVLTPEFIEDFANQSNFEFEKYEWRYKDGMNEKEKRMIESVKEWRKRIQDVGKRPFDGWNVKIYSSESKLENYRSLISAGGGSMIDSKPYTHIFADKAYTGDTVEKKIMSSDSIFSYLFKKAMTKTEKLL